ncbi:hypothetical protein BZA70DRAFT_132717 [Myxozyma melibiosi]|uniref:Vps72/YL1 C-terminal domain-containing protein n=1 Tax=Myxozyma melibiosi TaxID=54550 RepID=A0ABR1FB49_9ASCO
MAPATPPSNTAAPAFSLFDADITSAPKPFRKPGHKTPSRRIKNAKQIAADEMKRIQSLPDESRSAALMDTPTYLNVEAPPSVMPRKWWCDITGLKASYRMPNNGMRYHNKEIYEVIKHLPPGVDQQYLQLRSANVVLR